MMENQELNIKNLIQLLKLKFYKIFIITSSIVAVIIIYSLIMPHTYLSTSSIMPAENKSGGSAISSLLGDMASNFSLGGISGDGKSELFSDILHSKAVSDYIIKKNNLNEYELFDYDNKHELIDNVRKNIISDVSKSGITDVSYSLKTGWFPSKTEADKIAKLTSVIVNSAVEGLDSVLKSQSISAAKQSKIYVNQELKNYTKRLDSIELEIQNFQQKNNVLEISEQTNALVEQSLNISKEYAISEVEYNIAKNIYSDNSPQLKAYKEKFNILKNQYSNIQKGTLVPTDSFTLPLDSLPSFIRVYYDLMRKREIMEHVIIYLQTQYFQEAIQEQKDIPVVEVLDEARVPYKRTSPARALMVLVGSVISFILVVLIIIINAVYKGRLYLKNDNLTD